MKSSEINCKICGKSFSCYSGLHLHLGRSEKISQIDYYAKYFPRKDLLTGAPIIFKNVDDYFSRLFVDKKSEFKYLITNPESDQSKEILKDQLESFVGKSDRIPTYVEWRSSKNIRYDWMAKHGLMSGFLEQAKSLQFNSKYKYPKQNVAVLPSVGKVLIDTREQKPLFKGDKTSINVGDYTLAAQDYSGVHVDRKSKADFISTFTAGLDRFKRECEKAKTLDVTLVVLVEASFSDCFRYRPLKFTGQKVTGETAFHGVRKISREFDVQFLFVADREEAKTYVGKLLSNKQIILNYDIQFLYETGQF